MDDERQNTEQERQEAWERAYEEYQRAAQEKPGAREPDEPRDVLAEGFLAIARSMNHYEGFRGNATLDVLAGPSPADWAPAVLREETAGPAPDLMDRLDFDGLLASAPDSEAAALERIARLPGEPAEQALEAAWRDRCALPEVVFRLEAETPDEALYPAARLLEDSRVYRFLKQDSRVQKLFRETWEECRREYRACGSSPRRGAAGCLERCHRNELHLWLGACETPGGCRVEGRLRLNGEGRDAG